MPTLCHPWHHLVINKTSCSAADDKVGIMIGVWWYAEPRYDTWYISRYITYDTTDDMIKKNSSYVNEIAKFVSFILSAKTVSF